jgi:hypothetical protein
MLPPPTRRISGEEALALVKAHAPLEPRFVSPEYENEHGEHVVNLYEGGLTVDGTFEVDDDSVLVLGDLRVGGLVSDCRMADHTLLVVTGSLFARNAYIRGALEVGRDVVIDELLYLNSLNDFRTLVGGNVRASVLWEEGMSTAVEGRIDAHVLSTMNQVRQSTPPQTYAHVSDEELARWLIADVLGPDGGEAVYDLLARGVRLVRA